MILQRENISITRWLSDAATRATLFLDEDLHAAAGQLAKLGCLIIKKVKNLVQKRKELQARYILHGLALA